MLPASTSQRAGISPGRSNFYDNQQADLFGDPIPPPPPTGFVDNYDHGELYDPGGRSPAATTSQYSTNLSPAMTSYGYGYTTVPRTRSALANEFRRAPHNSSSYE